MQPNLGNNILDNSPSRSRPPSRRNNADGRKLQTTEISMNLIDPLEPEFNENGRIVDYITGDLLEDRPEERVRQRLERLLHLQYD